MSKGKIPSYFEDVVNQAKKTPGVGKYDLLGKQKILGNYTYATQGGGFTDSAVYMGQQSPSHYPAVDQNLIKDRTLSYKITPFKGDKEALHKVKKNDSPSPFTYRDADAYKSTQTFSRNYTISKGKKSNFAENESNRKKIVPGVGKYDVTRADKIVTLGLSKGWK